MQLYKNFCKAVTDENGVLKDFKLDFPEDYNFGYDVVDEMARLAPDDIALQWTNPDHEEKTFTFADISRLSNMAANVLRNNGVKKGDKVLISKYSGTNVKLEGEEYIIVKMEDILAVVE